MVNGYSAGYNDGTNYGNSNYGNNAQYDNADGISVLPLKSFIYKMVILVLPLRCEKLRRVCENWEVETVPRKCWCLHG